MSCSTQHPYTLNSVLSLQSLQVPLPDFHVGEQYAYSDLSQKFWYKVFFMALYCVFQKWKLLIER